MKVDFFAFVEWSHFLVKYWRFLKTKQRKKFLQPKCSKRILHRLINHDIPKILLLTPT